MLATMNAEKQAGFVAILTPIEVDAATPYEVAPGHWLRKAVADEQCRFKERLERYNVFGMPRGGSPYETDPVHAAEAGGARSHRELRYLPEKDWRYWVIAFEGFNAEVGELESACELIGPDLAFAFTFFAVPGMGVGWSPHFGVIPQCTDLMFAFTDCKRLREEDLKEIRENYDALKRLSKEWEDIHRALRLLRQLRQLDETSDFRTIGLFTVIEMLIVHNPANIGAHDSITHQVASKIPLLQRRFKRPVEFSAFIQHKATPKQMETGAIWKHLYAYLSRLVHGGPMDGGVKELSACAAKVRTFLWETVKCLVLVGLEEPQFLADLKRC